MVYTLFNILGCIYWINLICKIFQLNHIKSYSSIAIDMIRSDPIRVVQMELIDFEPNQTYPNSFSLELLGCNLILIIWIW